MGVFTLYYFDNQKIDASDLTNVLYVTAANIVKKYISYNEQIICI